MLDTSPRRAYVPPTSAALNGAAGLGAVRVPNWLAICLTLSPAARLLRRGCDRSSCVARSAHSTGLPFGCALGAYPRYFDNDVKTACSKLPAVVSPPQR